MRGNRRIDRAEFPGRSADVASVKTFRSDRDQRTADASVETRCAVAATVSGSAAMLSPCLVDHRRRFLRNARGRSDWTTVSTVRASSSRAAAASGPGAL